MIQDNMRWNVPVPNLPFNIDHRSRIICIGSCFAQEIGKQFHLARFDSIINPRGILFDPFSVARALKPALPNHQEPLRIVHNQGMFHSLDHHGSFSCETKQELTESIIASNDVISGNLPKTDVLIITFGTSVAWVWNEDQLTVSNCHRISQSKFSRKEFTYQEIRQEWVPLVCALCEEFKNLQLVITVSPVRYFKGDPFLNSTSKSHLLLAAKELMQQFDNVHYFPAYELLLDDLRDYRFYKDDLRHPSELAVLYIWEAFQKATMTEKVQHLNQQLSKLGKAKSHRPMAKTVALYEQHIKEIESKQSTLIRTFYQNQK